MFRLNAEGQLATGERCIDPLGDSEIHVIYCPISPTGRWQYANVTGHVVDRTTKRCATADVPKGHLALATCDEHNKMQQFNISPIPKNW